MLEECGPVGAALADPTDAGRTVPMGQIGLDDDPAPAVEVYKEGPRQGPSYASEPSPTMDSIPRKNPSLSLSRAARSGPERPPAHLSETAEAGRVSPRRSPARRGKGPRPSSRIDSFRHGLSLFFYVGTRTDVRF